MRDAMIRYIVRRPPQPLAVVVAALIVAACDTSVTNPGPTPDDVLDAPVSQGAVIAGARRAMSDALNTDRGTFILYWGAALTFEVNPAGSTGSFGITPQIQAGTIDDLDADDAWEDVHEARFTAEDGFDRFTDPARAGGTAPDAARAELALWAGYANRLLGETFCQAVLPVQDDAKTYPAALPDSFPVEQRSGSLSSHLDYFTRADEWFTISLDLGTGATATAARAGRASVRASLATYGEGSWADAASDAAAVTDDDFVFQALYSDQDQNQFNALVWANGSSPYRAHTQWGTFAEVYHFFLEPDDSRIDIRIPGPNDPQSGDAAVAKFGGRVHWHPQRKYPDVEAPVNLSSGWEMRLIEAEADLAGGNPGAAVDLLNVRRADLVLAAYDNTVGADSAWSLLKLERQVELWLEARRLNDLRRWADNAVPGTIRDGLYVDNDGPDGDPSTFEDFDAGTADDDGLAESGPVETVTSPVQRSLCFPVGRGEKETNPNVGF
jgi:hypothetical protein